MNRIKNGISHLHHTLGRPKKGSGPGNCGRVSSAGRSAIWWCNDESGRSMKELVSFGSIAGGTQDLVDGRQIDSGLSAQMAGQVFYKTNWNDIVRWDGGNCGTLLSRDLGGNGGNWRPAAFWMHTWTGRPRKVLR
ncbi:hypothetical protein CH063_02544 [Colletotrichum higginsianum]|uniref:Uncharacterized protein n=1 Tax=Colletotrichum higginsianum (strain IMI 349063) TaxID=759273 RepID=H1VLX2_COLHI|nr:hypothetical protein CH063_02544 [Colletotrichum higginsianum]